MATKQTSPLPNIKESCVEEMCIMDGELYSKAVKLLFLVVLASFPILDVWVFENFSASGEDSAQLSLF
jgi:hypothetical protein